MKILPFILAAAILAGAAMAEPAPSTNPPTILTKDEAEELIGFHAKRLMPPANPTLTPDELAFLIKDRAKMAAKAQAKAQRIAKTKAQPFIERFWNQFKWIIIAIGGLYLLAGICSLCSYINENWGYHFSRLREFLNL